MGDLYWDEITKLNRSISAIGERLDKLSASIIELSATVKVDNMTITGILSRLDKLEAKDEL